MGQANIKQVIEHLAPSGLMTTEQAASYLTLKPATLQVWRSTNRRTIPYVKIGGQVRYRRTDLDAFIDANLHNAPEAA